MFNNAGKKIQGVVSVLFVISVVLCILTCICVFFGMGISFSTQMDRSAAMIISGIISFICLVLGIFSVWISCLFLFAFGKIAESVEEQNELTKELINTVAGCKNNNETTGE